MLLCMNGFTNFLSWCHIERFLTQLFRQKAKKKEKKAKEPNKKKQKKKTESIKTSRGRKVKKAVKEEERWD